ncbi:MAG: transposase [Candidatus Marsarchaeota archaeon]|jgi:putative transposase|nr:transposase [Candidatus Marsarchaeota archaeon]MCL5418902.1 transposase [Candidatus Marsarchaeota archaeon]
MQLAERIEIKPTNVQEQVLYEISEKCRLIYNYALAERLKALNEGRQLTYIDQQNSLPKIKKTYSAYKIVHSKTLQYAMKELDSNFRSFRRRAKKDKNASLPKYKSKYKFTTFTYNQSGFKLQNGKIILSQFLNDTELAFEVPKDIWQKRIRQVAISKKKRKYYMSIIYDIDEKEYKDNGIYAAIDLGIDNIVASIDTNANIFMRKNKRPDKYWEKKIEKVQKAQAHCRRGSRRYNMFAKKIAFMKAKMSNQIKDFQHFESKKFVEHTNANTIIIGRLSSKEMSSNKSNIKSERSLHRALQNTGTINRFASFLTYKAKLIGKKVVEIDESNTTKMCHVCLKVHDMKLSDRLMECECGNRIERDINSAINIMERYLSLNAPVTGLLAFASNLRKTGLQVNPNLLNEEGCRKFAEMHSNSQKGLLRAGIPPTSSAERTRTQ